MSSRVWCFPPFFSVVSGFGLLFSNLSSKGHKRATGPSIIPKHTRENISSLCGFLRSKEKSPRSSPPQEFPSLASHWLESHDMFFLKPTIGRGNGITMVGLYQPRLSPLGLGFSGFSSLGHMVSKSWGSFREKWGMELPWGVVNHNVCQKEWEPPFYDWRNWGTQLLSELFPNLRENHW